MQAVWKAIAICFLMLVTALSIGWYCLPLQSRNPLPWAAMSVWGDAITVGMVVEQRVFGLYLSDSFLHRIVVIGSAAVVWTVVAAILVATAVFVRRALRGGLRRA